MTRSVGPHSGLAPPVSEVLKKKRLRTLKYGFAMEISSEVVCIIHVGVSIPLLRELGNAKSSVPFENKQDSKSYHVNSVSGFRNVMWLATSRVVQCPAPLQMSA